MSAALDRAPGRPRVSVVVPVFESQATLELSLRCLLAQEHDSYEVIAVDSSPSGSCTEILAGFPKVIAVRSRERRLPHAARNLGVRHAAGELLVFTDPDIYAPPDWLAALEAAYRRTGEVVVGALACHGDRWLARGIHWLKFSKWIAGGRPREVDVSPTANMLCSREQYEAVGGFHDDQFLGDTTFSWELRRRGTRLLFRPEAVAEHDHTDGLGDFLRERYTRGRLYAVLRCRWNRASRRRVALLLATTVLPVRFASNLLHISRQAHAAGRSAEMLAVLPVIAIGLTASLAGEARGYLDELRSPTPTSRVP